MARAVTATYAVACAQFAGLAISQMRYASERLPGAAPAATETEPSDGSRLRPALAETTDTETLPAAPDPLSVSLLSTLAIALTPANDEALSSVAWITNGGRTASVTAA